jgi:hypothetical protein
MKKLEKIADTGISSKFNDFLKEIAPEHKIDQIQFSNENCKNGHWEVQVYTYKGETFKRLVWVCD